SGKMLLCHTNQYYWFKNGLPKRNTQNFINILETALRMSQQHPGANHYYIHALEASPYPQKALKSADAFWANDYGIGHFAHMPSHIYRLMGEYTKAISANERAVALDEAHLRQINLRGTNYEAFYTHNLLFLTHTLTMAQQGDKALQAANKLANFI